MHWNQNWLWKCLESRKNYDLFFKCGDNCSFVVTFVIILDTAGLDTWCKQLAKLFVQNGTELRKKQIRNPQSWLVPPLSLQPPISELCTSRHLLSRSQIDDKTRQIWIVRQFISIFVLFRSVSVPFRKLCGLSLSQSFMRSSE